MSLAYEKQKARARVRSERMSLDGRDIAPLPPVRNPKERAACKKSLKLFCERYFKAKIKKEFGKHHLHFIRELEKCIKGYAKTVCAMPRGNGKTTLVICAAVYAISYGYKSYVEIIALNKGAAAKILDSIKSAVTNNRLLVDDFPEIYYPIKKLGDSAAKARGQRFNGQPTGIKWTAEEIRLPNIPGSKSAGATYVAVGLSGAIRGGFSEMPDGSTDRPDLIIIDDPQNEKIANSPKMVERMEETIGAAIEFTSAGGDYASMIIPLTVIKDDDLASRLLDKNRYPQHNVVRYKMLEKFPDNMELWSEYRTLRRESPKKATAFYRANRKEMQRGAVVSWDECYSKKVGELDALHHAMNRWCDNPKSFFSECQNEPQQDDLAAIVVPAKEIRKRLNGYSWQVIPTETYRMTAFIDVHDDILYYAVTAFADDFTGYVVDYGTWPEQGRKRFNKNDSGNRILQAVYRSEGNRKIRREAAVLAGVKDLGSRLLSTEWEVEDGGFMKIERLLIDTGWSWKAVEGAVRLIDNAAAKPYLGKGITAKTTEFSDYRAEPGLKIGHYWIERKPKKRSYPTVTADVNYWKSDLHDAISLDVGSRGGTTFWGDDPREHLMVSEHLTAEKAVLDEHGSKKRYIWQVAVVGQDNHLFDCLVGCRVAASHLGIKQIGDDKPEKDYGF